MIVNVNLNVYIYNQDQYGGFPSHGATPNNPSHLLILVLKPMVTGDRPS